MRAIDRMYFDKYAIDPEGENFIFDLSAERPISDPGDNEMEQAEWYDQEEWPEME